MHLEEFVELNTPSRVEPKFYTSIFFKIHTEEFIELNTPSRVEPKFYISIFLFVPSLHNTLRYLSLGGTPVS
jgi:hypothetical protein